MTAARPLLCYFGHHKCASTWIHSILENVCVDSGWRFAYLYHARNFGGDLTRYVRDERTDFVSYVNADWQHVRGLPPFRGFHVVRDPRDILVSGYFSHKNSHPTDDFPELPEHRARLQSASKADGLHLEMEFVFTRQVFAEMASWNYEQEHVLELRTEDLTADPYRGFLRIFEHFGVLDETHLGKRRQLPLLLSQMLNILHKQHPALMPLRFPQDRVPADRLLGIVHDQRFSNFAGGRNAGQADEKSHYRKGVAGDWKNHFDPEHVAHFKRSYNDLLLELGYEERPDWQPSPTVAVD